MKHTKQMETQEATKSKAAPAVPEKAKYAVEDWSGKKVAHLITPIGRVSYPYLAKPDEGKSGSQKPKQGPPKYKMELLVPKTVDISALLEAVGYVKAEFFGKDFKLTGTGQPIKDGDVINQKRVLDGKDSKPELVGMYVLSPKSINKPEVKDRKGNNIQTADGSEPIPGGYHGRCSVTVFPYRGEGEGVSFILNKVQQTGEGERFGGDGTQSDSSGIDFDSSDLPPEAEGEVCDGDDSDQEMPF